MTMFNNHVWGFFVVFTNLFKKRHFRLSYIQVILLFGQF